MASPMANMVWWVSRAPREQGGEQLGGATGFATIFLQHGQAFVVVAVQVVHPLADALEGQTWEGRTRDSSEHSRAKRSGKIQ